MEFGSAHSRSVGQSPYSIRPETGVPHDLEHFTIYFVTGFAFALGYDLRRGLLAPLLIYFAGAMKLHSYSYRAGTRD